MSRRICFTLFDDEHDKLWTLPPDCNYLIVQHERSASGRLHYQGYAEFNKKLRFQAIKDRFQAPTLHVERCSGDQQSNIAYCSKDDTKCGDCTMGRTEIGQRKVQGHRTDLDDIKQLVCSRKSLYEIFEAHPGSFFRYSKGIALAKSLYEKEMCCGFREVTVEVWWGATGTGKTRKAYADYPELYKLDHSENTVWWDGYHGQSTLLIDDFYGYIRYSMLLNLLDRYPMRLPIKGSHVQANWTQVIITSNEEWSRWYPKIEDTSALRRRITKITHFN